MPIIERGLLFDKPIYVTISAHSAQDAGCIFGIIDSLTLLYN